MRCDRVVSGRRKKPGPRAGGNVVSEDERRDLVGIENVSTPQRGSKPKPAGERGYHRPFIAHSVISWTQVSSLFEELHLSPNPNPTGEIPVTQFLRDWSQPDAANAGRVIAAVYSELRVMSSRLLNAEPPGHSLAPTALAHELYLRLCTAQPPSWHDRAHFFAVAATTLRRILTDHAR